MKKEKNISLQEEKDALEKTPLWEDIAIIVAVLTLWPWVLYRESVYARALMILAAVVMAFILVRRLRRVRNI